MLEACARAKIKPAISFHVLRHTHGSTLAMRGVPMGVIAEQLGHADTRMTEKHYAHLAPSYVADTIRAHFPTLGIGGDTTITVHQTQHESEIGGAAMTGDALPNLIEPYAVSDAFCTDLARIERIGPCVRLIFSVRQSAPRPV